jgi:hypothetical protein
MGAVFNQRDVFFREICGNFLDLKSNVPADMNHHHGFGVGGDPFFHVFEAQAQVVAIAVGQDHVGSGAFDGQDRGHEGVGRDDHVASSHIGRFKQRQQT